MLPAPGPDHDDVTASFWQRRCATVVVASAKIYNQWFRMPVANWMHVEDGKIARIRVAFDARGIAGAS